MNAEVNFFQGVLVNTVLQWPQTLETAAGSPNNTLFHRELSIHKHAKVLNDVNWLDDTGANNHRAIYLQ
jgi:hypothetical protein